MRPPSRTDIAILKPMPSGPRRASAGSWMLSKESAQVLEPRIPIFFSCFAITRPGVSLGIINAEMPFAPASGLVLARMRYTSASPELVIQDLPPLSVQVPSSFLTATERMPAASEPALASVRPNANRSPFATLGRYAFFCSSVPQLVIISAATWLISTARAKLALPFASS